MTIDVLVQPRSARERIGPAMGDRLRVSVKAPPVDGEANAALIALLASSFGVNKGAVRIVQGQSGRRKTVRIEGGTLAALKALLG